MYELWHIVASYVVGTVVGLGLFRMYIKEYIITATIDTLVEQEYVRSYEDEEGMVHLYKWHEFDDIIKRIKEEAYDEEDDTP